ncbi:MAG: hypothetical protein WCX46_00730 [Candidatus Paceibacterota bacterium]
MKTEKGSVQDGKLTNEQLGALTRRQNEVIRRINEGTLCFEEAMELLQGFVIEKKPPYLGVLRGTHEIKAIEHYIDCDAQPFIPSGWEVAEHKKGGNFKFIPSAVEFFIHKKQKNGFRGNKLNLELKDKKVLNVNVLDYLLAHPDIIPKEWKKDEKGNTRFIFFWGTIYLIVNTGFYVRYLCWEFGEWRCGVRWLDDDFGDGCTAALGK